MNMLNGFNLCHRTSSSLKTTHALAIYPNCDVMFENALHFLKKGLENSEVALLLSDRFDQKRLLGMRYTSDKSYPEPAKKAGLVFLGGVMGMYFPGLRGQTHNQKIVYSWAEMIREANHLGGGLRVFVDLQRILHHTIIEELISFEIELNSAIHSYGKSIFTLKIMSGCLEPDVKRLGLESFRLLQRYHNYVYIIPN